MTSVDLMGGFTFPPGKNETPVVETAVKNEGYDALNSSMRNILYGDADVGDDYDPEDNSTIFPFDHLRDHEYGDYGFEKPTMLQRLQRLVEDDIMNYILFVLVAFLVISSIRFRKDGVVEWWRRRKAAVRYKRSKKEDLAEAGMDSGSDGDDPTVWETLCQTFTKDKAVECIVDTGDGRQQKVDAYLGKLEKVSELPFFLQDACRHSGVGELSALSLVDLWLRDRARLQFTSPSGQEHTVDKGVTPSMLRKAKAFKATILPPTTR